MMEMMMEQNKNKKLAKTHGLPNEHYYAHLKNIISRFFSLLLFLFHSSSILRGIIHCF